MSKTVKTALETSSNLFPVVGIGASAGGLEAFKKLIEAIPPESGMAYIIVQHLAPDHVSALSEILQRFTKIPVSEIQNRILVLPDHIYIIPPNKMLVATDGILKLSPRSKKDVLNLPIDKFFSSLAEVHRSHAIGVVLSGNGMDGTAGLSDIRDRGGITIAQDLVSASYEGMPQHAIHAGIIDYILPPEQIPDKLLELLSYNITLNSDAGKKQKENDDAFLQIIDLLMLKKGADFRFYKQATIRRRIIRRMLMLKLDRVIRYYEHLENNKAELESLFQDLLIPVSSFFRDSLTFDNLVKNIFPELLKEHKQRIGTIRIWIAGCSTGQEAYSIAICLHEYLGEHIADSTIKIFGSDLSERSIKKARSGRYSKKEVAGVSELRLQQFFNKTDGDYQEKKKIRELCVFAVHDILKDPPFAKMDLISCRNVLIYFEPFLQKKAISNFHYALNEKGILWLGKSESIERESNLFTFHDKKDKFHVRISRPARYTSTRNETTNSSDLKSNKIVASEELKTDDIQKRVNDILLSTYTPSGVVVNEQFEITQFRGDTGKYLSLSPGKASLNVLKMAREGLSFELRNALQNATNSGKTYVKEDITVNEGNVAFSIEVVPILDTIEPHYLILFTSKDRKKRTKGPADKLNRDDKDERIEQLERELSQSREDMRNITEDQESANEELQSSNEELMSGGEELQSLNEELETSKEELQSSNEELVTLNQELFESNEELYLSRKFANATIALLHEPLLVLDKHYYIKSANSSFYSTFKLTEQETLGKVFFDLEDGGWEIPSLRSELRKIQNKGEKISEMEIAFEFPGIGKRIICVNIQPIHKENGERLIILAIDDITERKKTAKLLEENANDILNEQKLFAQELEKQIEDRIKIERQKNDFISMASHELKTPVTSIKGYAQTLQRKFKNEGNVQAEKFLSKMNNQINRLTALIGDLLDATQVTAGKLHFNKADFNFNELVTEIADEMQFNSTKHIIKTDLGPDQTIFGDRNRIGQVITNILSNAIKYSPGAGQVDISTTFDKNSLKCCVRDYGIGIPKENLSKVFEQFFRVGAIGQESVSGLGLGLFIASELVKRHEGAITVESTEGVGTLFCFTLPLFRNKSEIAENRLSV